MNPMSGSPGPASSQLRLAIALIGMATKKVRFLPKTIAYPHPEWLADDHSRQQRNAEQPEHCERMLQRDGQEECERSVLDARAEQVERLAADKDHERPVLEGLAHVAQARLPYNSFSTRLAVVAEVMKKDRRQTMRMIAARIHAMTAKPAIPPPARVIIHGARACATRPPTEVA